MAILGSDVHQCPTSHMNHRHWLIKLKYQMSESTFPGALLANSWIQPLRAEKEHNSKCSEEVRKLHKREGRQMIIWGMDMTKPLKTQKRKQAEEIMEMIKDGKRCSEIVAQYPQQLANIYQLARFRPQRKHRTDLIYYYGRAGVGKTTCIS